MVKTWRRLDESIKFNIIQQSMKFLKSYKLFESVDEIKSTIEDMLRDNVLDKDISLMIIIKNHHTYDNTPVSVIKIEIGDQFSGFRSATRETKVRVDELKQDIQTITSYLEDEEYKYVSFTYQDKYQAFQASSSDVLKTISLETNCLRLFYEKKIKESYFEKISDNMMHMNKFEEIVITTNSITGIVSSYLDDCGWAIDISLGNCAFFTKDFYEWCMREGIECKIAYLRQGDRFSTGAEIEDHIVPIVDGKMIDFVYTDQGVSRRLRLSNEKESLRRQSDPEITDIRDFEKKYSKWGYYQIEEITYEDAYEGVSAKCQTIDYPKKIEEAIKIPIEIGDTILGGRFKNKKTIVKKIGKNKKGDITINDKPLLKFRLVKESLEEDVNYYFRHLEDDNFVIQTENDYIRIFKPINLFNNRGSLVYSYSNCNPFYWSEISGEILRYVIESVDIENSEKSIEYAYIVKRKDNEDSFYAKSSIRKQIPTQMLLDDTFDAGEILSFTIGFK